MRSWLSRVPRSVPALAACAVISLTAAAQADPSGAVSGASLARSAASLGRAFASPYRPSIDRAGAVTAGAPAGAALPAASTGTPLVFTAPSFMDLPQAQTAPQNYLEPGVDLDAVRNQDVLFGGCTTSTPCASNETWTFDGDSWTKKSPASSPPARYDAVLVFDPTTNNTVLFGGIGSSGTDLSDTWVWDGTTWTQKSPSTHPSARRGAQAAYMPSLGKVVLFGGQASGSYQADTWTWDGTNWAQLPPGPSPAARAEGGLAQASSAGSTLLLYGGHGATGVLGDTWAFNGTSWSQQAPTATPGPLERFGMAYDTTYHLPVLMGGRDDTSTYYPSLWAWDGSNWELGGGNLGPSFTDYPGEIDMGFARPPTNGHFVMVGGQGPTLRDHWTYRIEYADNGFQPSYGFTDTSLTDRSDDHANLANQNLVYHAVDLHVAGVGLDLTIERQSNNLSGYVSQLLPLGWSLGFLDMATYLVADGSRVVMGPDGHEYYFTLSSAGVWNAPHGSDFGQMHESGGVRTVTRLHPQITYTFTGGLITKVSDRNGHSIVINRDANSRITSIVDTQGRSYPVTYGSNGYISTITDPTGRKVTYGFDTNNNLTSVTVSDPNDPTASGVTTYGYDSNGNDWMDQVTTPAGRISKYTFFGGMNRLSQIVRVDNPATGTGPTTVFDDSQPGAVKETDANSHLWTYTLDHSGSDHLARIAKTVDPNGHERDSSFDANSNLTSFNGSNTSAVYSLSFDTNNNMTAFTSPSTNGTNTGASTAFSYQTPGQTFLPSSVTDPRGNCRAFAYDTAGNLTDVYDGQTTLCDGHTGGTHLRNAYQGDTGVNCAAKTGELCSTTDGKGNVTSYSYDGNGNLVGVTPPSPLGATTIVPDSLGRPASVTDGKGQKTSFVYDKSDRITETLYGGVSSCDVPHTNCIQYGYDADGFLNSRVSNIGTTGYTYDNLGRLTKKSLPGPLVDNCSGQTGMTLGYDNVGNLTSYCDAGGSVGYGYDSANELTTVQEPGGNCTANPVTGACTKIAYVDSGGKFQDGRRTSITFPPSTGVVETFAYDNAGNVTSIQAKKGSTLFTNYAYTYGSGTKDLDQRQTSADAGTTTSYHYDAFGRLCWFAVGSFSNTCTSPPTGATSFAYDANGNRTSMAAAGTTTSYAYNAADELCATATSGSASCSSPNFSYDTDGNLTTSPAFSSILYNNKNQTNSRTPTGGSATSYSYADADQTERVTIGTLNLAVSPLGLAATSTPTYFTRDNQGGLLGDRTSGNHYYLIDATGSITRIIDNTGTITRTYKYDPFGNDTGTGTTTSGFKYASGYYETSPQKIYQFGTRYYDPSLGRWTQQDPIAGGIPNPATVNAYDYAGDDPINNIDPTGMLSFCDVGSWLSPLVGAGCNRHVQHLVRHHYEQIVEFGGGCLAGARIGAWYGTVVPVLGEATPIAGGVTGCLIGGAAGLYGGEQAIPEKP
jgi:RHS repeat-associated protein